MAADVEDEPEPPEEEDFASPEPLGPLEDDEPEELDEEPDEPPSPEPFLPFDEEPPELFEGSERLSVR